MSEYNLFCVIKEKKTTYFWKVTTVNCRHQSAFMKRYNILVLTDHTTHSQQNSVYEMCAALRQHPAVGRIHMASRGNEANHGFFYHYSTTELEVWSLRHNINLAHAQTALVHNTIRVDARFFDAVWLRLPRPIPEGFFSFLTTHIDEHRILNRPSGVREVGNKSFLVNFPGLIPPSRWVRTVEEIWTFHERFPIVLKPLENYGGRGVVKLRRGYIYEGRNQIPLRDYLPVIEEQLSRGGYLAMKFMKNVHQGDKRIVVVNGEIVGAALRMPPKGSWICNAAQGGMAVFSMPDEHERRMVHQLNHSLIPRGIAMYGIDTLVGDDGRRVLSEINALSIGGVKSMAALSNLPLVERSADLLMDYITTHVNNRKGMKVLALRG